MGTIAGREGSLCCGVTGLPGCRCKDQGDWPGDLARAARKSSDPEEVLLRSEYRIAEAKERLSGDWRSDGSA